MLEIEFLSAYPGTLAYVDFLFELKMSDDGNILLNHWTNLILKVTNVGNEFIHKYNIQGC